MVSSRPSTLVDLNVAGPHAFPHHLGYEVDTYSVGDHTGIDRVMLPG